MRSRHRPTAVRRRGLRRSSTRRSGASTYAIGCPPTSPGGGRCATSCTASPTTSSAPTSRVCAPWPSSPSSVPPAPRRVPGRLRRRRRVLRPLRVPDHSLAAQGAGVDGHAVVAGVLGAASPAPAAGVVPRLAVTVLAGTVALSPLAQRTLAVDAMAAGVFVVNFVFAGRFGDYFAAQLAEAQPSALLHYWSLAVEEQFYLLWPLVLVRPHPPPAALSPAVVATILAIAAASLVASVWLTEQPADVGLLPPPGTDGRAARRRRARRRRTGVRRRRTRVPRRARMVRAPRHRRRRDDLRRRAPCSRATWRCCRCCRRCSSSSPAAPAGSRGLPSSCCAIPLRCGSAGTRTPSTCGTGRCSSSPRRSTGRSRCRCACCSSPSPSALAAASLRLVEDPVRHSPWLARARRSRARTRRHAVRHRRARRGVGAHGPTRRSTPARSPPRRRWRRSRRRRRSQTSR